MSFTDESYCKSSKVIITIAMISMICWFAPWKFILTTVIDHQSQPAIQFSEKITKFQSGLCKHYEDSGFFTLNLEPWKIKGGKHVQLQPNYIKQTIQNSEGLTSENVLDYFSWMEQNTRKRFFLVAEEGEGKTTAIKYATYEWCNSVLENDYQTYLKLKYQFEYLKRRLSLQESFNPAKLNSIWKMISNKIIKQLFKYLIPKTLKPLPELVLAFELKSICSFTSINDVLTNDYDSLKKIIEMNSERTVFIFDGYEEFVNIVHCSDKIKLEVESIIGKDSHNMYKTILTSRIWKSSYLLGIEENSYEKLSFVRNEMTKDLRNEFIKNFFSNMNEDLSEVMISAIDSSKNIVPEKLLSIKGMLLYVCKIYIYNFDMNSLEDFFSEEKFFQNLLILMRITHNFKYPLEPMTGEMEDVMNAFIFGMK